MGDGSLRDLDDSPSSMPTVACPPPEQRRLYRLEHGNQNPVVLYVWACPVTAERVGGHDEARAREDMLAHDCGGSGWCLTPFAHKAYMRPDWEPTKEDRARWTAEHDARVKAEKELAKAARKAAREARGSP